MPYRSVFDGYSLTLYRSDGSIVGSWPAISGPSGHQRPSEQNLPFNGPLTEGEYSFSTRDIQPMTTYDAVVGLIPGKHGLFPHSIPAWGTERVALVPKSTLTNGRDNFFIHGGLTPGSAGCIDLGPNEKVYFDALRSSGEPSHQVIVSYDPSLEASPHPLAKRYVWDGVGEYLTRPLPSSVAPPSAEEGALRPTPAFRPDAVYSPDGYFIGNFSQSARKARSDSSSPDRQQSFADRFGNWGSTPAGGFGETRSPVLRELEKYRRSAVSDGPASISPTYAGGGGVGASTPMIPPEYVGQSIPFVSRPNGSLAAPGGSALLDSEPMNPGTPEPFSSGGRFVPRSLPSQPLYPIGELVPASNGRAHDRQGVLDDRSGYGSSSPADADRFRSPVLRELQKYRQLAASGVATAPSSAASNLGIPHASSAVDSGAEGASGGILKWIGNGLISSAEASPSKLLAQGNAAPGFLDDNDGSISDANEAASPSARDDRRYVSGRVANQAFAFDTSAPAVPFIASNASLSPDRPNSFDDRFGNWRSTSGVPQQASRPRGLFTGEPMPDWRVAPAIFDFPNRSNGRGDEAPKSGTDIPLLDEYIRYLNREYGT